MAAICSRNICRRFWKPPRSAAEIDHQFQVHSIQFHSLYRQLKRPIPGSIKVGFVISPNGIVTQCRMVATDFQRGPFVDALESLVCRMTFPAKDVAATAVPSVVISFAPRPALVPASAMPRSAPIDGSRGRESL